MIIGEISRTREGEVHVGLDRHGVQPEVFRYLNSAGRVCTGLGVLGKRSERYCAGNNDALWRYGMAATSPKGT